MKWSRTATLVLAALSLWVLAAHVVVDFPRTRVKLVTTPLAAPRVTLPLSAAARIPGAHLVLIYRVRNSGTTAVMITARLGDRVIRETLVAPGASARVDLAWLREPFERAGSIDVTGDSAAWSLEYAELANLHGFSRGAVALLVLPAGQPFTTPGRWTWLLLFAWAFVAATVPPNRWPRWARAGQGTLAVGAAGVFLLTALSPWLSPYRVVLAVHTFVLGLALIWFPHALHVTRGAVRWSWSRFARPSRATAAVALALITLGAALAYAVVLWLHIGAYAGSADSSGYLNNARLLSERRVSTPIRRVPGLPDASIPRAAYAPLGFTPHGDDRIAPTYPIGLPLLIAAAAPAFGWTRAPAVVILLHALAGVALTGLLARACGLPRSVAALGAVLLATSPLYLFMSTQLMSDTPALAWAALAIVLCCAPAGRRHPWWTDVLAGVAVSVAVLVRPTNVLVMLPTAICLGTAWRRWVSLAAGGVPGALLLLAYNAAAYGSPIVTGYGNTSSAFSMQNVVPSVWNYVTWLPVVLTPVGLLALGLPLLVGRGRMAVVLIGWAGSVVVFYAFYYHTHEWWWYLRFLLPAFPPLIVGALWVVVATWNRWCAGPLGARAAPAVGTLLTVFVLAHNAFWARRLEALEIGRYERVYVDTAAWARENVPAGATVLTVQVSGAFFYYTGFPIVRWDRCDRAALDRLEAHALDAGTPLYAVFFPFELAQQGAFDRIPGMWTRVGRVRDVTIWRLAATEEELSASPIVGKPNRPTRPR
jgi:hypothetical protein